MGRRALFSLRVAGGLMLLSIAVCTGTFSGKKDPSGKEVLEISAYISAAPRVSVTFNSEPGPLGRNLGMAMDLDAEERYLLAKIAMAEAESEDTAGKALVIMVVLNRVQSGDFPDSIEEVVYQPGQFSPVGDGRFDMVEPDADCWAALDLIMLDGWDGSCGATYFESESESTWHGRNLDFLFQHGSHYFYTDKEGNRN